MLVFRYSFQVLLRLAGEDQIGVSGGVVVNQVVQLGALVHVAGDRVFDGDAVEGDRDAVVVFDLHAGSVDVVFAGNSLGHSLPPFQCGPFLRSQCSRPRPICRMCENYFSPNCPDFSGKQKKARWGSVIASLPGFFGLRSAFFAARRSG